MWTELGVTLWTCCCLTAQLLLVYAGILHLRKPRHFAAAVATARLMPTRLVSAPVVAAWSITELLAGGCAAVLLLLRPTTGLQPVLLVTVALIHAGYGTYLWAVRARLGAVGCGCLGEASRATGGAVLRCFSLAVSVAAFALVIDDPTLPAGARAASLGGAVAAVSAILLSERLAALRLQQAPPS